MWKRGKPQCVVECMYHRCLERTWLAGCIGITKGKRSRSENQNPVMNMYGHEENPKRISDEGWSSVDEGLSSLYCQGFDRIISLLPPRLTLEIWYKPLNREGERRACYVCTCRRTFYLSKIIQSFSFLFLSNNRFNSFSIFSSCSSR